MINKLQKTLFYLILGLTGVTLFSVLMVDSSLFFPFIFTKVLIFRSAVEVMLAVYLLLVYLNKDYKPRLNLVNISLGIYVVLLFVVSLLGNDFHLSFWGDIERSEGLMLWLHMLAFLVIIGSVIKEEKHWLQLIDFSLIVTGLVALFALGQVFQIESILNTTGQRVASTIGNPAFLAIYLFFSAGLAAFMFVKRDNLVVRVYYSILFILFSYIVLETETRGAALGLFAGLLVAAILWLLSSKNKKVKLASASILVVLILLGGGLFLAKDSEFVKNNSTFSRIASISTQEKTAQTRLVTWSAAWQGFTEKPWGYGQEGFTYVFDKNFPPSIYEDEGSRVWFDRAHNLIFDKLITGGILGLALFLFFIFYPAYYLLKKSNSEEYDKNIAIIFSGVVVAYFVQAIFVFEAVPTYIIMTFIWGYLSTQLPEVNFKNKLFEPKIVRLSMFIIALVALIPVLYIVNIKPAQINIAAAGAMKLDPQTNSFYDVVDAYKVALESNTYGVPEYSIIFIEFIDGQLANLGQVYDEVLPALEYADNKLEEMISFKPLNAKNYLLAMRHYNYTFASIEDKKFERLDKALSFFPELEKLSPTRPHIYQEAGYSNIYKYRNYKIDEEFEKAEEAFGQAEKFFIKTIDTNPEVTESYINLIMLYLNAEKTDKVSEVVEQMEERGVDFKIKRHLDRLSQLAISNKNYEVAIRFNEMLVELEPENVTYWTNIALSYAYLGQNQKAIEVAESIKQWADEITIQRADVFIEEIKSGKYKPE